MSYWRRIDVDVTWGHEIQSVDIIGCHVPAGYVLSSFVKRFIVGFLYIMMFFGFEFDTIIGIKWPKTKFLFYFQWSMRNP